MYKHVYNSSKIKFRNTCVTMLFVDIEQLFCIANYDEKLTKWLHEIRQGKF